MKPSWTNFVQQCCALFLVCISAAAFPTESIISSKQENTTKTIEDGVTSNLKSQNFPRSSGSTIRTSLLPEDKKKFLSYVLGHTKKSTALKTPSHLMNPDKYEFYTFDDDGQIIKKLMSVQEIQRLIANSESGQAKEPSNPIEYYQIITVSPDIEPPPAVSRINPNEPLFSIHDVIASVQNVLKSEISLKRGVTKGPTTQNVLNSAKTDDGSAATTEVATTISTVEEESVESAENETAEESESNTTDVQNLIKITTYRPKTQPERTTVAEIIDSESQNSIEDEIAESRPTVISVPLLLSDAHPGLISNETYLEPQASFIDHLPQVIFNRNNTEDAATEKKNETEESTFTKTENKINETESNKSTIPESAMNQVQIPINQDLAESVSSVLSQIASEISLGQLDGSLLSTEAALTRANAEDEDNNGKKTENVNVDEIYITTELSEVTTLTPTTQTAPQNKSEESLDPSASNTLQNYLKPQNSPRPFEKTDEEEKETTTENIKSPEDRTTTTVYETVTDNDFTQSSDDTPETEVRVELKEGDFILKNSDNEETTTFESLKLSPPTTKSSADLSKIMHEELETAQSKINETRSVVNSDDNSVKLSKPTQKPQEDFTETDETQTTTALYEIDDKESAEARVTAFYSETTDAQSDAETETFTEGAETTTTSEMKRTESITEGEPAKESKPQLKSSSAEEESETETTELPDAETRTENVDVAESKILPEATSVVRNVSVKQDIPQKHTSIATTLFHGQDAQGTLKQNNPYKPFFVKPQKPVYIKPTKIKTPTDTKSPKPISGKPSPARDPAKDTEVKKPYENHFHSSPTTLELEAAPAENLGLEATTNGLDQDVKQFTELCNELAFSLWSSVTHSGLSFARSVVVSPFAVTSLLAMVFLGARGPTSGQMNDVLKLDEMVTFNPHLVFRNVTESLVISRNPGVATAAFVRELYSDRSKGKLLDFYKERAQQFYDGHVEEVNFKTVSDTLRRHTNHLVKRQTWGKISDFLKGSNLQLRPPLAAFSANIFQTDCTKASTKDRDGEMYFVVLPASRLRRLVPVPAVVWRENFLAGYEPNLDATVVAINPVDSVVSTIFVLPGQQGLIAPGDTLARLEHHLLGSSFRRGHWSRLMKNLLPRPGLEVQIPRFSHRSVINVTTSLQRMGLKDLFSADKADLTGLNGLANDLHLSDMLQVNLFSTCAEDGIGPRHISEVYPATPVLRREKSSDGLYSDSAENLFAISDFEDPAISAMPLELRPRQARIPLSKPGARIAESPRLRFDRPFLFFVRHNPTGLILHQGRFNPRLTT